MLAYHFLNGDKLRDGREAPANGRWLIHRGYVRMCMHGLHASWHPFDALEYAPGSTLCLVECQDIVQRDDDKFVCRKRKILKRFDSSELLMQFARKQALGVIDKWDAPDTVKRYLQTGYERLRLDASDLAFKKTLNYRYHIEAAWYAAQSAWKASNEYECARLAALHSASLAVDACWYAAKSDAIGAFNAANSKSRQQFCRMVNKRFRELGAQI